MFVGVNVERDVFVVVDDVMGPVFVVKMPVVVSLVVDAAENVISKISELCASFQNAEFQIGKTASFVRLPAH